jgi:hypothetical protein
LRAIDERELDNAMGIVEEAIRSSESG